MHNINLLAVIVLVFAAFVISSVYYVIFAKQRAALSPAASGMDMKRPPARKMAVELLRNIAVTLAVAYLVSQLGLVSASAGLRLALVLWIGFPLVLLAGSVIWENVPVKLAAIHCGDWLIKLCVLATVLSVWR